eukprot:1646809-Rhodomonas_salina.1
MSERKSETRQAAGQEWSGKDVEGARVVMPPPTSAPRYLRASTNVHALLLQLNSPRAAPHLFFSILTWMSIPTKM